MSPLLIFAQPRLQRLTHQTLSQEVDDLTDDDENKSDRVHPVNVQSKHLDTDRYTPEASGKQGNVEESSGAETEENRCK